MERFYWKLDGHTPVPCDLFEWSDMFQSPERIVQRDQIGEYWVSTVFLGLDHNWGSGPPLLFETMVFEPDVDGINGRKGIGGCERYSTWDEAEAGHRAVCERLRESG
jgi:hypothetical protein